MPPQRAFQFVSGSFLLLVQAMAIAPAHQKRLILADLVAKHCDGHTRQELIYYLQAVCQIGNLDKPAIPAQHTRDQVLHALIGAYRSVLANYHDGLY